MQDFIPTITKQKYHLLVTASSWSLTACLSSTLWAKEVSTDSIQVLHLEGPEVLQVGGLFDPKFLKTQTYPQYFLICRLLIASTKG